MLIVNTWELPCLDAFTPPLKSSVALGALSIHIGSSAIGRLWGVTRGQRKVLSGFLLKKMGMPVGAL
jgi:hypothetical protein